MLNKNNTSRSIISRLIKEFRHNFSALLGFIILVVIVSACLLAPLTGKDPNQIDASHILRSPSSHHLLGTDEFGRDILSRALFGGRVSLLVGFAAMMVSTLIGTLIGVFSGFSGGKIDELIMRMTDIFLALPDMLLMVILNAFLKPNLYTLILVLSMFSWASIARIIRAETMSLKERDFIISSQMLGANKLAIIFKHLIPNVLGTVIVAASLRIGSAILAESALSFLGLGVQIPQASWGSMLQNAQNYMLDAPLLAFVPGILIFLTVISFNLIGDGIRKAFNAKH